MTTSDLPSLPSPPGWLLPFAIITFIVAMTAAVVVYHFTFHRGLDIEPELPARSPSVVPATTTTTAPAQAYSFSEAPNPHANDNYRSSATGSGVLPLREPQSIYGHGGYKNSNKNRSIKARKYKTPKSRIQKIWEARMRAKAKRDAEAMTAAAAAARHYKFARDKDDYVSRFVDEQASLLPQTPDRWGIDEGGGSAVEMRLRGRRQQADELATTHARRGGRKRRLEGDFVPTPNQEPRVAYGGDGKRDMVTDEGEDGGGNGLLEKLNLLFERLVGYYEEDGGGEELVFPITEEERGGERVGWE